MNSINSSPINHIDICHLFRFLALALDLGNKDVHPFHEHKHTHRNDWRILLSDWPSRTCSQRSRCKERIIRNLKLIRLQIALRSTADENGSERPSTILFYVSKANWLLFLCSSRNQPMLNIKYSKA